MNLFLLTVNLPPERHVKQVFMKKIVKSTLLPLIDERQIKVTNSLKKAQQHRLLTLNSTGNQEMHRCGLAGLPSIGYGKREYKNFGI